MTALNSFQIIPANHNRSDGSWSDDDYDVVLVETGKTIGRIFRQTVTTENPNEWFWSLDFFQSQAGRRFHGHCRSKDAAMQAIAETWRTPA